MTKKIEDVEYRPEGFSAKEEKGISDLCILHVSVKEICRLAELFSQKFPVHTGSIKMDIHQGFDYLLERIQDGINMRAEKHHLRIACSLVPSFGITEEMLQAWETILLQLGPDLNHYE